MSLSKLIANTIKNERSAIALYFCSCMSIILFYYFLYDSKLILYPIQLNLFFLLIYLSYKFFLYKRLYEYLEESKESPSHTRGENSEFKDIFNIISEIHNSYISKICSIEDKKKEKEKLLVEWIHNMKTSVAIVNLAIEKLPKKDAITDIKDENLLIQNNLEGVLNIFRLDNFANDYVIEKLNLKSLVKEVINSQRRSFIYSDIFPEIRIPEEFFILSDKKWSKYVLVQIISNAIKYSEKGKKIVFFSERIENKILLSIKDEGIGIKQEELTRIFEPFFTGSNGRKNEKSSGIGLYMSKNICDKLNQKLYIESKEFQGTTVKITYLEDSNLSHCKIL